VLYNLLETQSQKSSRVPSPIAAQNYDDMESQFTVSSPPGKLSKLQIIDVRLFFLCKLAVVKTIVVICWFTGNWPTGLTQQCEVSTSVYIVHYHSASKALKCSVFLRCDMLKTSICQNIVNIGILCFLYHLEINDGCALICRCWCSVTCSGNACFTSCSYKLRSTTTTIGRHICFGFVYAACFIVLWWKPYWNWKPRFFVRTVENRNWCFLEPSEYGFAFWRLCLYMVQSQWIGLDEETESASKSLAWLNFPISYLSSYAHAFKVHVSTNNHCEVDWRWSSTQDLRNAIIHLAGCGHPWITCTGVCSDSIESATNTSRKFALAWQYLLPALYFSPLRLPTRRRPLR